MEAIKKIPLHEFCLSRLGYKAVKDKDTKTWRVLESPNGHKIITKSTPNENGHYLYRSPDELHGGTLIDLLLNVHGYEWIQIKDLQPETSLFPSPAIKTCPNPPKILQNNNNVPQIPLLETPKDNYLTKRGISLQTMQLFGVGSYAYSCYFPLWTLEKGKFYKTTAIKYYMYYGEKKRRFLGERFGGISILQPQSNPKQKKSTLYIFESPIDALSYYQLNTLLLPPCFFLLSLCGTPTKHFKDNMLHYTRRLKAEKMIFCLDCDMAGRHVALELKQIVKAQIETKDHSPLLGDCKDWNEKQRKKEYIRTYVRRT